MAAPDLTQNSASHNGPEGIDLLLAVNDPDVLDWLRGFDKIDGINLQVAGCENDLNDLFEPMAFERPVVLVLDDGFAAEGCRPLCQQILEDEKGGQVQILLLVEPENIDDSGSLGAILKHDRVEFVFKPVRLPELDLRVKKLVETGLAVSPVLVEEPFAKTNVEETAGFSEGEEGKLKLALNATSTGIWEWNMITNEVIWSEEIPAIFGLTPDEFKGTFDAYKELIHPQDVDKVEAAIAVVLADPNQPYHIEHRMIWLDGSIHWLEGKGQAVLDADGRPLSLIGVVSDITARKNFEEELRKSEERYRALVVNYPRSATVLFDHDLRLILVDGPIVDQFGISKVLVEGKKLDELDLPQSMLGDGVEHMRMVLQGESFSSTRRFLDSIVEYTYLPLLDSEKEVEYGMVLIQDVTEIKRAEEALRQSEEWLKNILSSNPVLFLVLDKKGMITFAQGKGLHLVGTRAEELVGRSVYDLYQDSPKVITLLEKALAGHSAHEEIEISNVSFDLSYSPYYEGDEFAGVIAILTDISERVRAGKALRESEERYSTLVNYANDGVIVVQEDRVKFVNRAMSELVGYPAAEIMGVSANKTLPPEEREMVKDRMARRLTGENIPMVYETRLMRKDGSLVDVETSARVIEFAGKPALFSIIRDITDRKKAAEELSFSEEKFAKAFYASPDSITISESETGKILDMNEGFEHVFGYSRDEAIGRTTIELGLYANPSDRETMIKLFGKKNRIKDLELEARKKSGEIRTCQLSAESIMIAGKPCLVTVVRDITETRDAEKALRLSERRYRLLAQNMPNSFILLLDPEMSCLLADGPELGVIGVKKSELEGYVIWDTLVSEFAETLKTHLNEISLGETLVVEAMLEEKTYSVTLLSLDDVRYDSGTVMILAQNVTEWKKVEKTRQEAEILRLELGQERELRELKSQFVSMVVHDFRNPVSVIQVSLHLLRKYFDRLDPAKRNSRIDVMLEQTTQLNQLIDDVLMIGEMEAVTTDLVLETHEIVLFCQDVFQEFIQNIDLNKFQVVFEDNNSLIHTTFDLGLMRRALFNLLSNAVKYSPNGGEICLRVIDAEGSVFISIEDEGIGIPEEHRSRLFDGFHRASNVGAIQGSGLGLAIVKQIVEAHAGEVYCESEVDVGTTFTIKLPMRDDVPSG